MAGAVTASIAESLKKRYEHDGIKVYHDHGDKSDTSKMAVKLVIGDDLSNASRISDADIIVVDENKQVIVAIIEIEEKGPISPKKMLGNFCTFLLADNVFLGSTSFPLGKDTRCFICGLKNERGKTEDKLRKVEDALLACIDTDEHRHIVVRLESDPSKFENYLLEQISTDLLR